MKISKHPTYIVNKITNELIGIIPCDSKNIVSYLRIIKSNLKRGVYKNQDIQAKVNEVGFDNITILHDSKDEIPEKIKSQLQFEDKIAVTKSKIDRVECMVRETIQSHDAQRIIDFLKQYKIFMFTVITDKVDGRIRYYSYDPATHKPNYSTEYIEEDVIDTIIRHIMVELYRMYDLKLYNRTLRSKLKKLNVRVDKLESDVKKLQLENKKLRLENKQLRELCELQAKRIEQLEDEIKKLKEGK